MFGGYGCDARDEIPPADTAIPPASLAAGEEQIVVVSRGPVNDPAHAYDACRFDEKMQNAIDKGYEGIIIANHHAGAGNGTSPTAAFCGSGEPRNIRGMCISHEAFHYVFDDTPDYDADYTPNSEPAVGTAGRDVRITSLFDGWGYAQLLRNDGNDLTNVDSFAVEEAMDERYATGFGDLSIHEFATDPTEYLAYSAYYAAGMRVFTFGEGGLTQTGKFIDDGGSNFWGVEQFTTSQGERLFAGSDRDYGLYLFRYTGPGAAQRPVCQDQTVQTPFQTPVRITLRCTDANGNPLTLAIASQPSNGTLSAIDQAADVVTYTPGRGYSGPDSFTFTANDGAATSAPATLRITVGFGPTGCRNLIRGTNGRDMIAGTAASDRVLAGSGDDVVDARGGNDCLSGHRHDDVIDGEGGNDRLTGGHGGDRLMGGRGADRLSGGSHVDRLNGEQGNDRISGGVKRDVLAGGRGADTVSGGLAKDTISGGPGNDRLFGNAAADRMFGNSGSDRIVPGSGRDRIIAAGGNDRINVRDGDQDRVSCGSGRDRVVADPQDMLVSCERVVRR